MAPRSLPLRFLIAAHASIGLLAEFTDINFIGETVCNASLSSAVTSTCRARIADKQHFAFWNKHLDFEFGRLSQSDWQEVRDQYTKPWAGSKILRGETPLFGKYDAEKSYKLQDFLPVNIRVLADHNFEEEDDPLPTQPRPAESVQHVYNLSLLLPNCGNTVYETLRAITQGRKDDTRTFHDVYSTDDKKALEWMYASTDVVPGPYREAKRQFGDVMFISINNTHMWRRILEHAVMFVDENVIWEKAGTGKLNPFRLTNLETVETEWKPDTLDGMFSWELRRPRFGAEQLKTFVEEFSLFSDEPDTRWPQFWQWPQKLQKEYTLGIADTKDPKQVDVLTLLKARRYDLCQGKDGVWDFCSHTVVSLDEASGIIV